MPSAPSDLFTCSRDDIIAGNEDVRRILAVLHSVRVLSWTYSKTSFSGTRAANDEQLLNTLCGISSSRTHVRRRDMADKLCETLENEVFSPTDVWTSGPFRGRLGALNARLEKAMATDALPPLVFPVDPSSLEREPIFLNPPPTIPGKFVATIRRGEAPAPLVCPRVFHMTSPLETRVGRSVEDTVGQWRHLPLTLAFNPRVSEQLALFAAKKPTPVPIERTLLEGAIGMEILEPNCTYDHVCPRASPGLPFEPIPESARFETDSQMLLEACNPSPRALLRGVLKQRSRGGRPRKTRDGGEAAPVVTPFLEELALTFMYWFHMFIETRRGWIAVPRSTDDEEPIHCFVIRSCDLSLASFRNQPVFGAGGACCLSTAPTGTDRFVCTRFAGAFSDYPVRPRVGVVHHEGFFHVYHEGDLPHEFGTPEVESQEPMPAGWRPELARVDLTSCGDLAAFMIKSQVAGTFPGCVRGDVLEMGLPLVARAVREAIFWTELMRTGGNTEVERLCRDFDIACAEAMSLVRAPSDMGPGWREAIGRVGMLRKVCSVGGTNHSFDQALVEQLKAYPRSAVELRSDSSCDAWGYRQWQVDGVNIVSIPGFCAREPLVRGKNLWFYSDRFDTKGHAFTPDSIAASRLKSKTRKFLGLFSGAATGGNATADSGINSFGRHFVPSHVRVLRKDAWSVVPTAYRFSPSDAVTVREAKILVRLSPRASLPLCFFLRFFASNAGSGIFVRRPVVPGVPRKPSVAVLAAVPTRSRPA